MAANLKPNQAKLQQSLEARVNAKFEQLKAGLKTYQTTPLPEADLAAPIWQAGTTLLRRYMPVDKPVARLVLVPSLINGAAILDITPSHSFCKALADQGIVVDLIDWQSPGDVECEFTLQDYNLKRVLPAVVENPIQGLPLYLGGYCLGGLMAYQAISNFYLAYQAAAQFDLAGLVIIAAPLDFSAYSLEYRLGMSSLMPLLAGFLKKGEALPAAALEMGLALLNPFALADRLLNFATFEDQNLFLNVERWLASPVPLAGPVAKEVLVDYLVGNQALEMAKPLNLPAYVLTAARDQLVPAAASAPWTGLLPQATFVSADTGHLGLMASTKAPTDIWPGLVEWVRRA